MRCARTMWREVANRTNSTRSPKTSHPTHFVNVAGFAVRARVVVCKVEDGHASHVHHRLGAHGQRTVSARSAHGQHAVSAWSTSATGGEQRVPLGASTVSVTAWLGTSSDGLTYAEPEPHSDSDSDGDDAGTPRKENWKTSKRERRKERRKREGPKYGKGERRKGGKTKGQKDTTTERTWELCKTQQKNWPVWSSWRGVRVWRPRPRWR